MKKRFVLLIALVAMMVAMVGGATPAKAWECDQLTSTTWWCSEGDTYYFVDCGGGKCIYQKQI